MARRFEYAQAEEIRDAFARHGVRTTQDADLFLEKAPANGSAAARALRALGFALTDEQAGEIERGKDFVRRGGAGSTWRASRSAIPTTSSAARKPPAG
jgi:hypothetical protein